MDYTHHLFRGKSDQERKTTDFHLTGWHCLDVGITSGKILDLSPGIAKWLCERMGGVDYETMKKSVMFWTSTHDLGKGTPAYVCMNKVLTGELEHLLPDGVTHYAEPYHGTATTVLYLETLEAAGVKTDHLETGTLLSLAVMEGSHHGSTIDANLRRSNRGKDALGLSKEWKEMRKDLVVMLEDAILHGMPPVAPEPNDHPAFVMLYWLTVISDWIASNPENFPMTNMDITDHHEYFAYATTKADEVLTRLGWADWKMRKGRISFKKAFPYISEINNLQKKGLSLCPKMGQSPLVLIESMTGGGKSELALYIADYLSRKFNHFGCYFAMPTQATANGLFPRLASFANEMWDRVELQLVHGKAKTKDKLPDDLAAVTVTDWFCRRKANLIAPLGIGTLDQVAVGVINDSRHHLLSLGAMFNKAFIVDEAHAWDVHSSTVIDELIPWLRELKSPLIILSATLTAKRRKELIRARLGDPNAEVPKAKYPRITIADEYGVRSFHFKSDARRDVPVHVYRGTRDATLLSMIASVKDGGNIAWICNTVGRAEKRYQKMLKLLAALGLDYKVHLFHSRMTPSRRKEIETKLLHDLGKEGVKDGTRTKRSIWICTQVVEQSLDIDFDGIWTDPCPIDLIIQRVGRCHRFGPDVTNRPANLMNPGITVVITPPGEKDTSEFSVNTLIYAEHILKMTMLKIGDGIVMHLPEDTDDLIESVYGPEMDGDPLYDEMKEKNNRMQSDAAFNLVSPPNLDEYFCDAVKPILNLDDSEALPLWGVRRSEAPVVEVIFVRNVRGRRLIETAAGTKVFSPDMNRNLLAGEILPLSLKNVSPWLIKYGEDHHPEEWAKIYSLKYIIVVELKPDGSLKGDGFTMHYSRKNGFIYEYWGPEDVG